MHGLVDRHPAASPERLIVQLVSPPTFAEEFCRQAVERRSGRQTRLGKLFGKRAALPGVGLYLDGGFGVGKTHLLAWAYDQAPTPKAFATFGELTQLAGVFGFAECIDLLAGYTVVCVDEFELDDPGNTTLISRMLSSLTDRLYDAGVPVVASGAELDTIFSTEMLAGGYRKKYLRATSRLLALTAAPEP
jgi:cell division protein ZapE